MIRRALGLMTSVAMLASPLPAQARNQVPDPALEGHYYLSGVMETGSELLLKTDGRFEWFISYGAVDQFAQGRWFRDGDTVTLIADVPSATAPLFRLDERTGWNEAAEERFRERQYSQQVEAVMQVCPWATTSVASSPPMLIDEQVTPGATERAKAAEAKANAIRARDAVGP
ncbi:MAG: hypothetical protein RIS85_1388, partial [Pseudomonadota bacterium]